MKYICIALIDIYRYLISPLTPRTCRFYPSCSNYAKESFLRHGFIFGAVLTLKRLLKCHPFHDGGFDPVPTAFFQEKKNG